MENEIFIPTMRSFKNGNTFSGSCGLLRFYFYPDPEKSTILVKIWHGLFCIEKSEVEECKEFDMTEEGIEEIRKYLYSKI